MNITQFDWNQTKPNQMVFVFVEDSLRQGNRGLQAVVFMKKNIITCTNIYPFALMKLIEK